MSPHFGQTQSLHLLLLTPCSDYRPDCLTSRDASLAPGRSWGGGLALSSASPWSLRPDHMWQDLVVSSFFFLLLNLFRPHFIVFASPYLSCYFCILHRPGLAGLHPPAGDDLSSANLSCSKERVVYDQEARDQEGGGYFLFLPQHVRLNRATRPVQLARHVKGHVKEGGEGVVGRVGKADGAGDEQ
jgi:hypothetical protein